MILKLLLSSSLLHFGVQAAILPCPHELSDKLSCLPRLPSGSVSDGQETSSPGLGKGLWAESRQGLRNPVITP